MERKRKVLMNDGHTYVGYINFEGTCMSVYTDERDDAMFVGLFELIDDELWDTLGMSGTKHKVGWIKE